MQQDQGIHPITLHRLPRTIDHEQLLMDLAKAILLKIDPPRTKRDIPVPPIVGEIYGLHKAGKDTQLVKLDNWFRRQGFQVWISQESAETKDIRATARTNPYAFEMRHFAYTFANLLSAPVSRDFHFVMLNRGVIDTLCWLERHHRKEVITPEQYRTAKDFILSGPWIQSLDVLICLTCSVEASLEREFGKQVPRQYGSRMNPEELTLMRECVLTVCAELRAKFPNLPMVQIDTTDTDPDAVNEELRAFILRSVEKRLQLHEDDIFPHSISLLRENAWITGPEIKLRGIRDHEIFRKLGWRLEGATEETDIYITPKDRTFLEDGDCFHLRKSANNVYFAYKSGIQSRHRAKIHIPIPAECVEDILSAFDVVAEIKKKREIFTRGDYLVHRDHVDGLGDFTEIEALSVEAEGIDVLTMLAEELGFTQEDICRETYIRLKLKSP